MIIDEKDYIEHVGTKRKDNKKNNKTSSLSSTIGVKANKGESHTKEFLNKHSDKYLKKN